MIGRYCQEAKIANRRPEDLQRYNTWKCFRLEKVSFFRLSLVLSICSLLNFSILLKNTDFGKIQHFYKERVMSQIANLAETDIIGNVDNDITLPEQIIGRKACREQ